MIKSWDDEAWADYLYWQTQDKKTLKRINNLLKILTGTVMLELANQNRLPEI